MSNLSTRSIVFVLISSSTRYKRWLNKNVKITLEISLHTCVTFFQDVTVEHCFHLCRALQNTRHEYSDMRMFPQAKSQRLNHVLYIIENVLIYFMIRLQHLLKVSKILFFPQIPPIIPHI